MSDKLPLVTVAILTYNSSRYVLETLESIKSQTYKRVELLICDDCSTDNTAVVCKDWLEQNEDAFFFSKLIVAPQNKGIAPNCNVAVQHANGEWIKLLGGDDLLTPHAIESYSALFASSDVNCIVGNTIIIDEHGEEQGVKCIDSDFFSLDSASQLTMFRHKAGCISTPAVILRRRMVTSLNGFDERFPMMEDFPFYEKCMTNNFKFYGIDIPVVKYRVHSGSVQRTNAFSRSHIDFVRLEIVPRYKKEKRYIDYWHDLLWSNKELARISGKNVKAGLLRGLMLLTDGKEWYYIFRDKIYRPLIFSIRN